MTGRIVSFDSIVIPIPYGILFSCIIPDFVPERKKEKLFKYITIIKNSESVVLFLSLCSISPGKAVTYNENKPVFRNISQDFLDRKEKNGYNHRIMQVSDKTL